jgi:hypothetical protein
VSIAFDLIGVSYAARVDGHRFSIGRVGTAAWWWIAEHARGGINGGTAPSEAAAREECERQLVEMNKRGTRRRSG